VRYHQSRLLTGGRAGSISGCHYCRRIRLTRDSKAGDGAWPNGGRQEPDRRLFFDAAEIWQRLVL